MKHSKQSVTTSVEDGEYYPAVFNGPKQAFAKRTRSSTKRDNSDASTALALGHVKRQKHSLESPTVLPILKGSSACEVGQSFVEAAFKILERLANDVEHSRKAENKAHPQALEPKSEELQAKENELLEIEQKYKEALEAKTEELQAKENELLKMKEKYKESNTLKLLIRLHESYEQNKAINNVLTKVAAKFEALEKECEEMKDQHSNSFGPSNFDDRRVAKKYGKDTKKTDNTLTERRVKERVRP